MGLKHRAWVAVWALLWPHTASAGDRTGEPGSLARGDAPSGQAAAPDSPPGDAVREGDIGARATLAPPPSTEGAPSAVARAAGKTPPPPYSLPWQLRPALAVNVVRSDTAIAFYEDAASNKGTTAASLVLASYKVTPEIAPLLRLGIVENSPPTGERALSFVNPVVGAVYAIKPTPELRLALFLGFALPFGQGGGNAPDASRAVATRSGLVARSAMDNAMFAVNDFVVIPGADLAWLHGGFTVQLETTLLQLTRVRGENVQADASRTNLTAGIHVGYFVVPQLSLGAELRHQRWLSTPAAVEGDARLRDTTTVALGPRLHIKAGDALWLRPGIAYARGVDRPMTLAHYNIVQIDVPIVF